MTPTPTTAVTDRRPALVRLMIVLALAALAVSLLPPGSAHADPDIELFVEGRPDPVAAPPPGPVFAPPQEPVHTPAPGPVEATLPEGFSLGEGGVDNLLAQASTLSWEGISFSQSGGLVCGLFRWRTELPIEVGDLIRFEPAQIEASQHICWDKFHSKFTNAEGGEPENPTVRVLSTGNAPISITKGGLGGTGVSNCLNVATKIHNRTEIAGGRVCTLEFNLTIGGGAGPINISVGDAKTVTTPTLDFWRIPGQ